MVTVRLAAWLSGGTNQPSVNVYEDSGEAASPPGGSGGTQRTASLHRLSVLPALHRLSVLPEGDGPSPRGKYFRDSSGL